MMAVIKILIICLLLCDTQQQCIYLKSPNGYLGESTNLDCGLEDDAIGDIYMLWSFKKQLSDFTYEILANATQSGGSVTVTTVNNYIWKVDSTWNNAEKTFTLTIKNTTLADETFWRCEIIAPYTKSLAHVLYIQGEE